MNAWATGATGATFAAWREPLVALGVGGAVVVCLAAGMARMARGGKGRRAVWQAALLGLAALLAFELSGIGAAIGELLRRPASAPIRTDAALEHATPRIRPTVEPARPIPTEVPVVQDEGADWMEAEHEEAGVARWPAVLWLAGALVLATRACGARGLLVLFRRRRPRVTDAALDAMVRSLAARLRYRGSVLIIEAERLLTPAAFGVWRPTLALPARFRAEFTSKQQQAMLAHELAHLAGHDPAWHFLADCLAALLWWHPLVWWARRQLWTASEWAADEASLAVPDGPAILADCLVALGGRVVQARSAAWVSMAGRGFRSGLGRRVERLLRLDSAAQRPLSWVGVLGILVLGPALLVAASVLSTAWARSPALAEGDVPMNSAWKRSLAAVAFVALVGSADPAPGGAEANQSAPSGESRQQRAGHAQRREDLNRLDAQVAQVREEQASVAAALAAVQGQEAAREQDPNAVRASDAEKVREELRELAAKAKQLQARRAELEARLKALAEKKAKLKTQGQPVRIKVFRLKHRDPNEISAVLAELLPQAPLPQLGQGMMGGPPGGMIGGGMGMGGMNGMAGMGGMMGMQGGGMGGFGGRAATSWRLAQDERTNSLIARGTEEDLKTIADIVAALDQPENKTATKLKNFRTFKLKHADIGQVSAILQELDMQVTVSVVPSANLLAVSGSEAALKEVAELIAELDVEGKPMKEIKKKQ